MPKRESLHSNQIVLLYHSCMGLQLLWGLRQRTRPGNHSRVQEIVELSRYRSICRFVNMLFTQLRGALFFDSKDRNRLISHVSCQSIHVELIRACWVPRARHRACYFQQYHRATWSMVQWSMSHDVPWCPMTMLTINATSHSSQKAFHLCHWPQNHHRKYLSAHPTTATGFFAAQDKISSADAPRPGRRRQWNNQQQNSGNCFALCRMSKDSPHRFQTPAPKLQESKDVKRLSCSFPKHWQAKSLLPKGTGFLYVQG